MLVHRRIVADVRDWPQTLIQYKMSPLLVSVKSGGIMGVSVMSVVAMGVGIMGVGVMGVGVMGVGIM